MSMTLCRYVASVNQALTVLRALFTRVLNIKRISFDFARISTYIDMLEYLVPLRSIATRLYMFSRASSV